MSVRLPPVQQRGLIILIATALVASGLVFFFSRLRTPSFELPAPIELTDVQILLPIFSDANEKINLNTASAVELTALPGIGDVLAARIVAYRQEHGPFQTVDALAQVSGIGDKLVEKIRDLVVLEN